MASAQPIRFRTIRERIRKIIEQRQIIKSLTVKNLKSKYIGSALGISWAIINPILITLAVAFIFTQVMKSEIKHYPIFVLSGLLPWFFFVNSICEATTSLNQNLDILNRFVIPKEIIPISVVLANFINFLIGFVIMLPVFIVLNTGILKYLLLLPLITLLLFIFTLGVSMLFSIINVYFRDLSQLLNIGVMFLFWLTPVFYSLEIIPQKYHLFILVNPATSYVIIYQSLLYRWSLGNLYMWLFCFFFALVSLACGFILYLKKENEILRYI